MKKKAFNIVKLSDALLPTALLIASLLGRASIALWLFICLCGVKLCALSTSDGLRRAFASQPSVRSVQGSAILALILQYPGAIIAALLARITHQENAVYPLITCGLLLNIEHVFYEYLFAIGDDHSATLYRAITAVLTLTGLLLCAPPSQRASLPANFESAWLLGTSAVSVLIGLTVSLFLGGKMEPKINSEVLRNCPTSMLQTALYPVAALVALRLLARTASPALPLFSGLILYALCRSPFRRTPAESWSLNQALLVICVAASAVAVAYYCFLKDRVSPVILLVALTVILAALCAFALYGNIRRGRRNEA